MKKIEIQTDCKKMLADIFTPVGIYLRLRDRFRDTILLESADYHVSENSYSFICINAIGGIEITSAESMEFKLPGQKPERVALKKTDDIPQLLWNYMQRFQIRESREIEASFAQGLFGYTAYDAVQFFEPSMVSYVSSQRSAHGSPLSSIPLIRYRLYQYVIAIHHFKDELFILENRVAGLESERAAVESLIQSKDVPLYPFQAVGNETAGISDEGFKAMVGKGIQHCHRGDVFQVVLSRRFGQRFAGDEFNVYRSLRSINPSPYLFYFDYGDYKLMGSSPEAQLVVKNGKAVLHPIAGTYKRTGDDRSDKEATERLLTDAKENAEHVMLVDLARNDLSRLCDDVRVDYYRQVQYFSHVIHLVSEVSGKVRTEANPFALLAKTFPAGTLSGAPKIRAMQLIAENEPASRSFYGGCIGFMGFNGSCNHAIMIRTLLSKNNTLIYQAGAGIVAASMPENELQEVNNKLQALKKAIWLAERIR
jgi:anthranilate synthase component 1